MAIVTSTRNFIRNLGGTLGLAFSGTIINNAIRETLRPHGLSGSAIQLLINTPDRFRIVYGEERAESIRVELASAYAKGFRIIFIISAVLNALAFIAAWFLMPQIELRKEDDAKLKLEGEKRHAEKHVGVEA
jgi:hypothetical protein